MSHLESSPDYIAIKNRIVEVYYDRKPILTDNSIFEYFSELKWEHCVSALLLIVIENFAKISDNNLRRVHPKSFLFYTKTAIETLSEDVSRFLDYPEVMPLCQSLIARLERVLDERQNHEQNAYSIMTFDDFFQNFHKGNIQNLNKWLLYDFISYYFFNYR